MASDRKCPNCGARLARAKERFCGFCGHEMPRSDVVRAAPTGPYGDLPSRFRALSEHNRLQEMMEIHVSETGPSMQYGCLVVFGVIFALGALPVFIGFAAMMGPLALFPLAFIGVGVAISIWGLTKYLAFKNAPMERYLAVVVGERQHVSGGGHNSSSSTSYHVTIELEDGEREEYRTSGKILGRVSPGDIGVAHVKGGHLLGFARAVV